MNEIAEAKIKEVIENFDFKKVIKTMKFLGYGYGVNSELSTEKYLKQTAEKSFKNLLEKNLTVSCSGRFLYKRNGKTNDFYMCFISEEYYTVTKGKDVFFNLFWYLLDNPCPFSLKRKIMKKISHFSFNMCKKGRKKNDKK